MLLLNPNLTSKLLIFPFLVVLSHYSGTDYGIYCGVLGRVVWCCRVYNPPIGAYLSEATQTIFLPLN